MFNWYIKDINVVENNLAKTLVPNVELLHGYDGYDKTTADEMRSVRW